MTTPLRVLWSSNSPWTPSGYGKQTKHALDILSDLQHRGAPIDDVALFAFYGLQGGRTSMGGRVIYGNPISHKDPWGNQSVRSYYKDFDANLLVTLIDAWILDASFANDLNWVPYFPVDHEPIPPAVLGAIQNCKTQIAMSEYGMAQSRQLGLNPKYAPHCYDANLIHPLDELERKRARDFLGFESGCYYFGMVAHNVGVPSRKAYAECFAAMQKVIAVEPNARLYVHAEARPGPNGIDLVQLAQMFGLMNVVTFPDPAKMNTHFSGDKEMNYLFNALDCLLSPSYGEGFGVPIIEAQGAGTPVITQDCTAMTEITAPGGGWCIPKGRAWLTPQMAYQWMPEPEQIAEAMLAACSQTADEETERSQCAEEFARSRYDIRVVRDRYWEPLVHELADLIGVPDVLGERVLQEA